MERFADPDYATGQILDALANSRRRIFVRYLRNHSPCELKIVSQVISNIEHCSQKSAYTSLYQAHVDKLAAAKIIEQTSATKTYTHGPNFETACKILKYCDSL
jgi:purine nucleoside phosphorylase